MKSNLSSKANLGFASIILVHLFFFFLPESGINSISTADKGDNDQTSNSILEKSNVFNLTEDDEMWIEKTMESMTLYEKCAQIFMPAVFGNSLNQSSKEFKSAMELVRDHGIGGIVVSTGSVAETAIMINELQKNASIPLLVSADFENGIGMRMSASNIFPHNMAIGATFNPDFAFESAKATAIEALMLGVNINFAPVADINNNPENPVINLRSFSEDKNMVADFCKSFFEGTKEAGVIATAKHFPGHGNTKIDSHNDLPVINGSKDYLFDNELKPFIELIQNNIQAIMIGHLNVPAFDTKNNLPASLSHNIITKLLIEQLGYNGLIITDALDMKAVTNYYSAGDACVQAFKAGNDILLMPANIKEGITAIYNEVKAGTITEARLDVSVRKILSAKRWLKLEKEKFHNNVLPKRIRMEKHYKLSKTIAENSVTVVKLEDKLLPLNSLTFHKTLLLNITNRSNISDAHFSEIYNEDFSIYRKLTLTANSKLPNYKSTLDAARECDLIIIASYFSIRNNSDSKSLPDNQIKFINDLIKINKKIIFISFENPYVLSLFPETKNYFCTFSNSQASQRAVLNLLNGSIEPVGKLPISIPNTLYNIGYKWEPNS
ncbi:MAG TPA: glycoside hydrolase family 3 N-terminal domain-containing protein [Ignavibacteriaceae bacterium]